MTKKNGNAAPAGPRNGADSDRKAAKLSQEPYSEQSRRATFFWDRHSNSVEPLAMRQAVLA